MRASFRFRVLIEDELGTLYVTRCIGVASPSNHGVRRIGTSVRGVEPPAGRSRHTDVVFFCSPPNGCDDVATTLGQRSETRRGVVVLCPEVREHVGVVRIGEPRVRVDRIPTWSVVGVINPLRPRGSVQVVSTVWHEAQGRGVRHRDACGQTRHLELIMVIC